MEDCVNSGLSKNQGHQQQQPWEAYAGISHFGGGCLQFSSVAQSCPILCDPMSLSTPGPLSITNSRSLLKLMPIELVMPSSHLIPCHPLLFLPPIPPNIRVFSKSQLFSLGGQSTGVSASASVLPMNTQD